MTMSEGTRAIVREIAFEAAGVIRDELKTTFAAHIDLHQATCPTKAQVAAVQAELDSAKNKVKGMTLLLSFVAAVIGALAGAVGIWAALKG